MTLVTFKITASFTSRR